MSEAHVEARRTLEARSRELEGLIESKKKEREAVWRKHKRLGEQLTSLDSELRSNAKALDALGGPLPEEDEPDDEEAAE